MISREKTRRLALAYDELHEAAARRAGFYDFGDPTYRQGLRVLLSAFDSDIQLTEIGWQAAYDMILGTLVGRLYAQKGWAEHPEVLVNPIRQPLIITGLPRTGTTALHRLLAVDSQFQGLEYWLSTAPMIRPPRETWETHRAYWDCIADLQALYARIGDSRKAHDIVADEVEECTTILEQSFVSSIWSIAGLPSYEHWVLTQSARETYHRYVDVLRLIGAGEPNRLWLLKSPHHMGDIRTLLEVLPDACIIQTHRDPLKTIPSYCSALYMFGRDLEGDAAQPQVLGPRQCAHWRKALDQMQAVREQYPTRFFDVEHRHFLADPLGTVRSVYKHFGLSCSSEAEQRMRIWIVANSTSRHGTHTYADNSWGITADEICTTFADYRAQHQFD